MARGLVCDLKFRLAGPSDFPKSQVRTFGSPDELGNGLIRFDNQGGTFMVAKDVNPQRYDGMGGGRRGTLRRLAVQL